MAPEATFSGAVTSAVKITLAEKQREKILQTYKAGSIKFES